MPDVAGSGPPSQLVLVMRSTGKHGRRDVRHTLAKSSPGPAIDRCREFVFVYRRGQQNARDNRNAVIADCTKNDAEAPPMSAVTEVELPAIIERMEQRLSDPLGRRQASDLWSAAFILLGLRYSRAMAAQLLRGVVSMKESTTYQMILEEGEARG